MMKRKFFLASFLCFPAISLTFTDSVFDRLKLPELEAQHQRLKAQSNTGAYLDSWMTQFFLAEHAELSEKPHTAKKLAGEIEHVCQGWDATQFKDFKDAPMRARAQYLCVLNRAEFGDTLSIAAVVKENAQTSLWLSQADKADLPFEERAYLDGRIYSRLPEGHGRSVGRSLLGLQALKRLRPEMGSVDFLLGKVYEQRGLTDNSDASFKAAMERNPPDERATLVFGTKARPVEMGTRKKQARFYWGIIGSPWAGIGGRVGYLDDQLWDTDRSFHGTVYGASRGVGGAAVTYEDGVWLSPLRVRLDADVDYEIVPFYGLGMNSLETNLTEVYQTAYGVEALVLRPWAYFFVGGGLGLESVTPQKTAGVAPVAGLTEKLSGVGPVLTVGYDSKRPHFFPNRGVYLIGKFFAPIEALGESQFTRLSVRGGAYWNLGAEVVVQWHALFSETAPATPLSGFGKVSGTVPLPGVRYGRYQGRAVLGSWVEMSSPISQFFRAGVFGTTASVAPTLGDFGKEGFGLGGGAALIAGRAGACTRIEIGMFKSETVFQASLQIGG